jgi:F-type H+-transporting ATPase subunit a
MRHLAAVLVLLAATAHAESEPAPSDKQSTSETEGEGGKEDVAGFIFHHVADSDEYEFELPFKHHGSNPVIHLPIIRIPLKAGACPEKVEEHAQLSKGCLDLSITKHVVMMWLAAVLLILTFALGANHDKKNLVPHGTSQNLLEMLVLYVRDEIAIKNIGKEEGPRYTSYLLTAFFFILFMNLIGLFPWLSTPTSNLAVTAGLALCTFLLTQVAAIRAAGFGGYLKHLTGGVAPWLWPIMVPVEILGLFTKPFALTVRLFANMLAGHIVIFFLLGLIFIMGNSLFAIVSVPFAMMIYFLELFVALVQAYIFTMLSSLFIGMAAAMKHHDEHPHPANETAASHEHAQAHAMGS